MKILFVDNSLQMFMNFRGNIVNSFLNSGYDVSVVIPNLEKKVPENVPANLNIIQIEANPHGFNPFKDFKYFMSLYKFYHKIKPDIIFHYTIKPNIYGSLAASLLNIKNVSIIAGLGYAFNGTGLRKQVAKRLYRFALKRTSKAIVLNKANYNFLLENSYLPKEKLLLFKGGEGVDLEIFKPLFQTSETLTLLLVSRLLYDKGLIEFLKAAELVKDKNPEVIFEILGPEGGNSPMAFPLDEIKKYEEKKIIKYLGSTDNVMPFLNRPGTVVVLPSYHEGLSRSLMEACATGCPIIASDIPGCQETVNEGVSGFLVEPKNPNALAEAMFKMISLSPEKRAQMGLMGRLKAENEFDVNEVINTYYQVINELNETKSKK